MIFLALVTKISNFVCLQLYCFFIKLYKIYVQHKKNNIFHIIQRFYFLFCKFVLKINFFKISLFHYSFILSTNWCCATLIFLYRYKSNIFLLRLRFNLFLIFLFLSILLFDLFINVNE